MLSFHPQLLFLQRLACFLCTRRMGGLSDPDSPPSTATVHLYFVRMEPHRTGSRRDSNPDPWGGGPTGCPLPHRPHQGLHPVRTASCRSRSRPPSRCPRRGRHGGPISNLPVRGKRPHENRKTVARGNNIIRTIRAPPPPQGRDQWDLSISCLRGFLRWVEGPQGSA